MTTLMTPERLLAIKKHVLECVTVLGLDGIYRVAVDLVAEVERLQTKISEVDAERLAAISKLESLEARFDELRRRHEVTTNSSAVDFWDGPCAHGRLPVDRCDLCGELWDDGRKLAELVKTCCIRCGRERRYCECQSDEEAAGVRSMAEGMWPTYHRSINTGHQITSNQRSCVTCGARNPYADGGA